MNSWLKNIYNFITNNKKSIITILFFIIFFSFDNSFAETSKQTSESAKNSWYIPLVIMSAMTGFASSVISIFLNPEWTNGSMFGLNDVLKNLWVLVSNVVYFIFAFILIFMALMNIIGNGKNEYEIKTALPKFIVGILIIPFSWFIVQFVVSISSLLTVSILSLPYDVLKPIINADTSTKIKTNCKLDLQKAKDLSNISTNIKTNEDLENAKNMAKSIWDCKDNKTLKDIYSGNSVFSIMSIYTYAIFKVDIVDTLRAEDLKHLQTITDVFIKLGFDLIFLIVYLILCLAIALALFIRGVYLWVFMMVSPVFGLLYFFGDKKGGDFAKKYNFKGFISLALVPVYVASALSFGLLFVFVASPAISSGSSPIKRDSIEIAKNDTFTIVGLPGSTESNKSGKSLLGDGLGSIGKLFMIFVSIGVLWIAVMAALNTSTITREIITPIYDFGKNVGQLVAKAPTYAPILPGGMSISGATNAGNNTISFIENKYRSSGEALEKTLKNAFGIIEGESDKLIKKYRNMSVGENQKGTVVKNMIENEIDFKKAQEDAIYRKSVIEVLGKFGVKLEESNFKNDAELAGKLGNAVHNANLTGIDRDTINKYRTSDFIESTKGHTIDGGRSSNDSGRLPKKTNLPEGINIRQDSSGNITHIIVNGNDLAVTRGKIENSKINDLVQGLKNQAGQYGKNDFINLLKSIGIIDSTQQEAIWNKYANL